MIILFLSMHGVCLHNIHDRWPKSLGVGDSGPDYSDIHHMRPADCTVNAVRGNLLFASCGIAAPASGCITPAHAKASNDTGKDKIAFLPPARNRGDIARALMYMELRYGGDEVATLDLILTDCPTIGSKNE